MMSQTVEKRRLKKLLSGTSQSKVMYVVVVQVTGGRFSRATQPTETNPKTLSFSRPYWLGRYDSSWDSCKSTESLSEPPCRSLFLLLDLLYLYQMMRYDEFLQEDNVSQPTPRSFARKCHAPNLDIIASSRLGRDLCKTSSDCEKTKMCKSMQVRGVTVTYD